MEQLDKLLDTVLESINGLNKSHKEINGLLREVITRVIELEERVNNLTKEK